MDNFGSENIIALVIWLLIMSLITAATTLFLVLNSKARKLADAHSLRLAGIRKLNNKYHFVLNIRAKYQYPVYLPNKRSFDSFDPFSYFGGLVIQDKSNYELLFKSLEANKQQYPQYLNEIAALPTEIPKEVCQKHTRIPYELINWNEKRLIKAATIVPPMDSKVFSM